MKPNLSVEELVTFRRKLLYARWLYQKGTVDSQSHDVLSHLTAMMHFHAIEIVLHNIALAYGWVPVAQLRTRTFEQMLNAVDNKGGASAVPPRVPQRTQILRLADMRNSIMHHGQRFSRSEVDEARATCRLFLRDAIQDFLDEDIDSMSMADLVENRYIADLLRLAEKHKVDGDHEKAIGVCAVVVHLAEKAFAFGLSPGASGALQEIDSALFHAELSGFEGIGRVFKEIGRLINDLYVNQCRGLLLATGVDVNLALRFGSLDYSVSSYMLHAEAEEKLDVTRRKDTKITSSDCAAALAYTYDAVLKVQSIGLSQYMTRMHVWRQPEYFGSRAQVEIDLPSELIEADMESPPNQEDEL